MTAAPVVTSTVLADPTASPRERAAVLIAAALHGPAGVRWVFHPDGCPTCTRAVAVAGQLADLHLLTGEGVGA